MILIYSQIQDIIQPIKCQAKGKLIIGILFPKGSHSNRKNEHLNIQEEIAEDVVYTMIRICTKHSETQRKESLIIFRVVRESFQRRWFVNWYWQMSQKTNILKWPKRHHVPQWDLFMGVFGVWKLEESFTSTEQAYAQSLLLLLVLCWVSVYVMEKKKKSLPCLQWLLILTGGKSYIYEIKIDSYKTL